MLGAAGRPDRAGELFDLKRVLDGGAVGDVGVGPADRVDLGHGEADLHRELLVLGGVVANLTARATAMLEGSGRLHDYITDPAP
ncbi:hypothetical protein AB0C87_09450 [Actinomadura sp. NPDC048021]|uniref:hypothetical protein n=1 Tax=Actinomadura sp. NPDC048021 TaxID=3155385 RepID=UPI0033D0E604